MIYKALMAGRTGISSAGTESPARKSVEDARAEADKLKGDAQTEAKMVIENAYLIMSNAQAQAKKLIDDANEEAAGIRQRALQILYEAKASQAGINRHA